MTQTKDMIGGGRPMRPCGGLGIGCGQVDDHPRHVIDTGNPEEDVAFHLDCHASYGCESCAAQVQGRPKNATGQKMLDHIVAIHADLAAELADADPTTQQEG